MKRNWFQAWCVGMIWVTGSVVASAETANAASTSDTQSPVVALFVQNRAGVSLENKVDMFGDLLSADLSNSGFSVMRGEDVIQRFSESRLAKESETTRQAVEWIRTFKSEGSADETTSSASAVRLAEIMGADYVVMASLLSEGVIKTAYQGFDMAQQTSVHTLRMALRVLNGVNGASLYGDTVTVNDSILQNDHIRVETSDMINTLLERGANQLATHVQASIEKITSTSPTNTPLASITFSANVPGATIEVDGTAVGSTPGTFQMRPGLHQVRISKEWYATWEKTVNVRNGQVLDVAMELTPAGLARKGTQEEQARVDDVVRQQSDAAAAVAGGAATQMSNSYIRLEGMPNSLSIGDGDSGDKINVIQTRP